MYYLILIIIALIFFLLVFIAVLFLEAFEFHRVKNFITKYKQNIPVEVVIVLGNWGRFWFSKYIKPNYTLREIKAIIEYLKVKKQNFSFYVNATVNDIERIMNNKNIREVYFLGHGESHCFKLEPKKRLFYCDFNNIEKYGKEYVHQVHCGTPDGKSLIDYVVPEQNRNKCFIFRKTIRSVFIAKEFKRKTAELNK